MHTVTNAIRSVTLKLAKNIFPYMSEAIRRNKAAIVVRGDKNISSTTPDPSTIQNPSACHSSKVDRYDISWQFILIWAQYRQLNKPLMNIVLEKEFSCYNWFDKNIFAPRSDGQELMVRPCAQ